MITLILTLFISLCSLCSTNGKLVDHQEHYVDNVVNIDNVSLQKNSLSYDSENPSNGYVTSFAELGTWYFWQNSELILGDIWSRYTEDYGNWTYTHSINVSDLYVCVPLFYPSLDSYDTYKNYIETNYSSYEVYRITIFNRYFSSWSTNPVANSQSYYAHSIDMDLIGGQHMTITYYAYGGDMSLCTVNVQLKDSNYNVLSTNPYNLGIFALDTFTLNTLFYVESYVDIDWDIQEKYNEGYQNGYNVGISVGDSAGYTRGYNEGVQDGYADGLANADYDSTAMTIFTGILDVGLLPVNVFLQFINFEVFGINISGFVSGLLTVSIVIIIIRFLFGGKNDK